MSLSDRLEDMGAEKDSMLAMTGFDDCVVGVLERFGMGDILIYDRKKVIDKLISEDPAGSHEDAVSYYEFNQLGGWHGDRTPGFLVRLPPAEDGEGETD